MDESRITPNEAEKILNEKLQLLTARRTILNYERDELMAKAWRSENGRETYYTLEALTEFYASWKLLHGEFVSRMPGSQENDKLRLAPKVVAYARQAALELIKMNLQDKPIGEALEMFYMLGSGIWEIDHAKPSDFALLFGYALIWLDYKNEALAILES